MIADIAQLVLAVATLAAVVLAKRDIKVHKEKINSRVDELIDASNKIAYAKGVKFGKSRRR